MRKIKYIIIVFGLIFSAIIANNDQFNTIWLAKNKIKIQVPCDWEIIVHSPNNLSSSIGFQLMTNKAEDGTAHSTNIVVNTIDLTNLDENLSFVKSVIKKTTPESIQLDYKKWAIQQWVGIQDKVSYTIYDAKVVHDKTSLGVHIRLAFPNLPDNPKDYNQQMKTIIEKLISSINEINPDNKKGKD